MPANFESVPDAQYMFCTSHSIIYKHIKIIYKEIKGGGVSQKPNISSRIFHEQKCGHFRPSPWVMGLIWENIDDGYSKGK